nr:MAG TPA: hypothetical protein [Bacteriophage sp.]
MSIARITCSFMKRKRYRNVSPSLLFISFKMEV